MEFIKEIEIVEYIQLIRKQNDEQMVRKRKIRNRRQAKKGN